jgi:hypothetical protein
MSERTINHTARTGEMPTLERRQIEEPREVPLPPDTLPEERKDAGATTGIMRIKVPAEGNDQSAKGDADKPAGV